MQDAGAASERAEQLRCYQGKAETERQLSVLRASGGRAADRRGGDQRGGERRDAA